MFQALYVGGPVANAPELVLDDPPGPLDLGDARLVAVYFQLPFQVEVEEPLFLGFEFGKLLEPAIRVSIRVAWS